MLKIKPFSYVEIEDPLKNKENYDGERQRPSLSCLETTVALVIEHNRPFKSVSE